MAAEKQYLYLHRFSIFLSIMTLVLVAMGGLVHSQRAGLSVPDWPTTYHQNMFLFPISQWKGGILYEHSHRLIASLVGFLMIVELVWIWILEKHAERKWLKNLSFAGFIAVSLQGILGGMTVLYGLPTWVSVSHGLLADGFFIMTVAMVLGTSPHQIENKNRQINIPKNLQTLFGATLVFTFFQIMIGAITRHTYSGLAIPDFPLANGKIIPDFVSFNVLIHFAHRIGAVILASLIIIQGIKILRSREKLAELRNPALAAIGLVLIQIYLGAMVIFSLEGVEFNTLHTAVGAAILASNFIVFYRSVQFFEFTAQSGDVAPYLETNSVPKAK